MGQKQGKVWKERSYKAAAGLPTWYSTKLREVGQVEVGMVAVQALVTPMDLPNELELLQDRGWCVKLERVSPEGCTIVPAQPPHPPTAQTEQVIEGDGDRIPCLACGGTGTAATDKAPAAVHGGKSGAAAASSAGAASSADAACSHPHPHPSQRLPPQKVQLQRTTLGAPFGFTMRSNDRGDIFVTSASHAVVERGLQVGDIITHLNGFELFLLDWKDVTVRIRALLTLQLTVERTKLSVLHVLAEKGTAPGAREILASFETKGARRATETSTVQRTSAPGRGKRLDKRSTVTAAWLHENGEGGWEVFEQTMATVLESAWKEGAGVQLQVTGPVYEYQFDLMTMVQKNMTTGHERAILRLQDEKTQVQVAMDTLIADAIKMLEQDSRGGHTYVRIKAGLEERFGEQNFGRCRATIKRMCRSRAVAEYRARECTPKAGSSDGAGMVIEPPAVRAGRERSGRWYWQAEDVRQAELADVDSSCHPDKYVAYPPAVEDTLETAYRTWTAGSGPALCRVDLDAAGPALIDDDPGPVFSVDFRLWTHTNLETGTVRSVQRDEEDSDDDVFHDAHQGTTPVIVTSQVAQSTSTQVWLYKDELGEWAPFDDATAAAAEKEWSRPQRSGRLLVKSAAGNHKHILDVGAMVLENVVDPTRHTEIRRETTSTPQDDASPNPQDDDWDMVDDDPDTLAAPMPRKWNPPPMRVRRRLRVARLKQAKRGGALPRGGRAGRGGSPGTATRSPGSGADAEALPQGWEKRTTKLGMTFFLDHNTKTSQWGDPRKEAAEQEPGSSLPIDPWIFVLDHDLTEQADGEFARTADPPCWVCRGSGKTSKWLAPAAVNSALVGCIDPSSSYDCCVCYDEGQFGLAVDCGRHFYCTDCIVATLNAVLEAGQFPAICPMCRAEHPTDAPQAPLGQIDAVSLSFLQRRGVISRDFLFRFEKAARLSAGLASETSKYFGCPAKCGRFLLAEHASYVGREPGKFFREGEAAGIRLGACPCGAHVCVMCHTVQSDGPHACVEAHGRVDQVFDKKTLDLIAKIAKRCPACGNAIEKNTGCDVMMCGTSAHGKVRDAIRNGGCAYIFHWASLAEIKEDSHVGLDGKKTRKSPITDRQVLLKRSIKWRQKGSFPKEMIVCDDI